MTKVKGYSISMEVAGRMAMWRGLDSSDYPVSYPVPTMCAAKGLFESIAYLKSAAIWPYRVELCSPIIPESYNYNNGGISRKKGQDNTQIFEQVYRDVRYKLYAVAFGIDGDLRNAHYMADKFTRRLVKGQCFVWPFLGRSEFKTSYYGPLRADTSRLHVNIRIGPMPMLLHQYSKGPLPESDRASHYAPIYSKYSEIRDGTLNYADNVHIDEVEHAQRTEGHPRRISVTWSF